MFFSGENLNAVVADVGSHSSRIGFAGEDAPRAFHPSAVGMYNADGKTTYTSSIPHTKPPANLEVGYPVVDGIVADHELYQHLWEEDLRSYLKTDLKDTPVLLTEKPFQSAASRYKLAEMFFENFQTSALFIAKDATLSCYGSGKTTGLAVDMGASGVTICPVVEGFCELKALVKNNLSSRYLDGLLLNLLTRRTGYQPKPLYAFYKSAMAVPGGSEMQVVENHLPVTPSYAAYMNLELGRDIRETICRTAEGPLFAANSANNFNQDIFASIDPRYMSLPSRSYELPDGNIVTMHGEQYVIPEMYFDPAALGESIPTPTPGSSGGIHKLIINAILQCDVDIQHVLLANIIVGGGNIYEGFQEKLKNSLEQAVFPALPNNKIKLLASPESATSAWIGGSIVASLGSLHEMWVSRKEYDEFGANVLDRKCP